MNKDNTGLLDYIQGNLQTKDHELEVRHYPEAGISLWMDGHPVRFPEARDILTGFVHATAKMKDCDTKTMIKTMLNRVINNE
jgi:hypothetical protein